VSNSSSSSFIIGCRGKVTKTKVMELLGVNKSSPLYPFAEDMAKFIADNAESAEDRASRYGDCDEDDGDSDYKFLKEKGFNIYYCRASNDGDAIEQALYNINIDNRDKSDDFVIVKQY
jgi:hypothetical protein